ncbi:MAG: glucosamine-6-phosphate deaminase [Bdellovibrionales bacterium]|nr:glucosamine-6-phosphate deaminase [Bdellovibrionales bacterium]
MRPVILRYETKAELYPDLIHRLQGEIENLRTGSRNPVLALPTGNTMVPLYGLVTQKAEQLKVSTWKCFQLDEYYPLKQGSETKSFRAYLEHHFFSKVEAPPTLMESPDGFASDPEAECERYEKKIAAEGGIDLALLGIGTNGHIAFNEPGSPFDSKTRVIDLHPETLASNFKNGAPIPKAMTIGIGTLLQAKKIWVVALSKTKAKAVQNAIEERMNANVPASALQLHPNVTWFLDSEAASLL